MPHYHRPRTGERTFPSTTWHWKEGSLRRGGAPESRVRAKASSVWLLRARDPRRALDLQVRYYGGPEGYWEAVARGQRWLFPGCLSFSDVFAWINRTDA